MFWKINAGRMITDALRSDFRRDIRKNWTHGMTGYDHRGDPMPLFRCQKCGLRSITYDVYPGMIPCPPLRNERGGLIEFEWGERREYLEGVMDSLLP